jgi:hypothetical protein
MFESEAHTERGSPSLVGRGIANPQDYVLADTVADFESYLKAQKKRNVRQIMCYAQKYHTVLETGDATAITSLSSGALRRHAMESLTALSKFNGSYDRWQGIRKCYSLKWTSGDESLQSLQRFFNPDLSLDVILQRIKQMVDKTRTQIGNIIRFACLVGLRPTEVIESVKLLNNSESFAIYYDPKQMTLTHFRFPSVFLRQTKKAYISFVTPEMLQIVQDLKEKIPTYGAIRHACMKVGVSMDMRFCRKVFASHLRHSGIQPEVVDMLQGRVSQSILTRHYLVPNAQLRDNVLASLTELWKKLRQNEWKRKQEIMSVTFREDK